MSEYINNSVKRLAALRDLIRDLHAGADPAQVKARFQQQFSQVSAVEIAQMEQQLIAEGLPADEIKALCDVHVAVFQDALQTEDGASVPPGHPVHTFRYENWALGELLALLEEAVGQLPAPEALPRARTFAEQLGEINKLYLRKENLLFPFLERHGVTGPASVMWGIHDEIRAQLKALRTALAAGDSAGAQALLPPVAQAIRQMFYKEEHILYPTALKMLTEGEWAAIYQQSDEIGYALVRPTAEWRPDVAPEGLPTAALKAAVASGLIPLDTGALTAEQINLILTHLPFDITYVDEYDTVRYFSAGKWDRIFTRTPSIIGRKVQNCHPPASLHLVSRVVQELRDGVRDMAPFWIQMGEKFVYIVFIALRDAEGRYRGAIEITQNIAPLRALSGERRLLDENK